MKLWKNFRLLGQFLVSKLWSHCQIWMCNKNNKNLSKHWLVRCIQTYLSPTWWSEMLLFLQQNIVIADNFPSLVNVDAGKCLIKMWSDKSGFLSFNILKCIQHHFWNEVGKKVNITATPEKRISKMNVRLGVGKPLQKHTLEMK